MTDIVADAKRAVRERVWDALGAAEPGVHGTIPAFIGAEVAAERLAGLAVWDDATVIKAVPDRAQLPVRVRALNEGKVVYMAVPKMADLLPFSPRRSHSRVGLRNAAYVFVFPMHR